MNAGDWQAAAEWVGIFLTVGMFVGNFVFTAFNYRMLANFVTHAEFSKVQARMIEIEDEIDNVQVTIGKLATTEDLGGIYNRIGSVDNKVATMTGTIGGLADQMSANNHLLQLLVKNELDGGRK